MQERYARLVEEERYHQAYDFLLDAKSVLRPDHEAMPHIEAALNIVGQYWRNARHNLELYPPPQAEHPPAP